MKAQTRENPVSPPYLGAAWYPENWPAQTIDQDIALMTEAGINIIRVGEFAWACMEPHEGEYAWAWLDECIEKLARAGIGVVLGTPTATPPVWLTQKHPEILFEQENGTTTKHGGRRHADPTSSIYREYTQRIVTEMAKRYGQANRVIGWQIDNELYPPDIRSQETVALCCTPSARKRFAEWLQETFGTIETLNHAWCTNLWSQRYDSFEQIPIPGPETWHHPALRTAATRFQADMYIEYVNLQAGILHQHVTQPVGTNMMPLIGVDHVAMNRKLDVVQFDHYFLGEHLPHAAFWFDYLRNIKPGPFWNIETAPTWAGNVITHGYNEKNYLQANCWLCIALGGEMNAFWHWRQHRAGQELMHGSFVQSHGEKTHAFPELKKVARDFKKAADFLNQTTPESTGLGLMYSNHAANLFANAPLVPAFSYTSTLQHQIHRVLTQAQWRPDVIGEEYDLRDIRMLMTPFLLNLDTHGLRERLHAWVQAGGVWIAGPLTDCREPHGSRYTESALGSLEEWAGIRIKHQVPGNAKTFNIRWADGIQTESAIWADGIEPVQAETLGIYQEHPLEGLAAATTRPVGKGRIIVLGTLPPADQLLQILGENLPDIKTGPVAHASESLLVAPRTGPKMQGLVAVELQNKVGRLRIARPAIDILTGENCRDQIEVPPYGVKVLRYTE